MRWSARLLGRVMRQRRSIAAAMDYVKALSRGTRANCWELAEEAGHEGPHRMQALLRRYKWPWEKLRDALPALAAECLPDDPDDLIGPGIAIDETADLKKGHGHRLRLTAACGGHREGRELRDLGVRRPGHRARAGVGRFRRVHARVLGEGPAAPGEGPHPGGPEVRHEAGAGHCAAETADGGRGAGHVGRRGRGLRALRRVPGGVPRAGPGLRRDHPLRLPGHPREEHRHPR